MRPVFEEAPLKLNPMTRKERHHVGILADDLLRPASRLVAVYSSDAPAGACTCARK